MKSPNPAFRHVDVPLASTFILSSKAGKESYVEPIIEGDQYRFTIKTGKSLAEAKNGTKLARANFGCLLSGTPISGDYIKSEGQARRIGAQLMAVVAEGQRERTYLAPTPEHEATAQEASPAWRPEGEIPTRLTGGNCTPYGLALWGDLFTPRQLVALTAFSDLVREARDRIRADAFTAGVPDNNNGLNAGGTGALAYAEAVAVYLAFIVEKMSESHSTLCTWSNSPKNELVVSTFRRQALLMTWDFGEANPFADSSGSLNKIIQAVCKVLPMSFPARSAGYCTQAVAQSQEISAGKVISTDPPYYDNIGYADLSDFFYVWLRRALRPVFPDLFATVAVPKAEELVATPYRHGSKEQAETFFLDGMTQAMQRLAAQAHPAFPVTIYYAFKQAETDGVDGTTNSGWDTFLDAIIRAGFAISGTWPMRTERDARSIGIGTNALASSIVLVCRPRPADAAATSRRAFQRELNQVLPQALDEMTRGAGDERSPVAPVDLSQAIIGPGMAVFSKYAAVLEADGTPMSVRTALQLINRFLAEDDFDQDTQFCLHWFEQHGWKEGRFGEADTLARAKGTSVDGVRQAGVLYSAGGVVRLLKWSEYAGDWDAEGYSRLPIWEVLHQLIRIFKISGERGAGAVLGAVAGKAEATRQLAYRLYTLCERAGWAEDAGGYNELVTSWGAIEAAATAPTVPEQGNLFD